LPRPIALELLLTGRTFTAEEAHAWGLVNRVVEKDAMLDEALALARMVCRSAPFAVRAVLDAVTVTRGMPDQEAFRVSNTELESVHHARESADAKEGPRAFAEGRVPRWEGR
jgi:crotonobetainyl-CoA hydratase